MRTAKDLVCPECGEFLENTAGGNYSTCPKMHGKLKPKLTPAERRHCNLNRGLRMLPKATRIKKGRFSVKKVQYKSKGRFSQSSLIRMVVTGSRPKNANGHFLAYCSKEKRPFLLLEEVKS